MTPPRPAAPRALIVEDDDDIRAAMRLVLEDEGWDVAVAGDGEEALAMLREDPAAVSVVLVDLMMPRLGGIGFLKQKALEPALVALPVVVVSAIPDMAPVPQTADVRAVLRKPVSTDRLLEAVRRALEAPPDAGTQPAIVG